MAMTRDSGGGGGEASDLVGTTVAGRYHVTRLLGRGGMGAVYEATQQPLGRKVALKVIRRALSDEPSAVKRFTQEAQAVAQLSHPNIVTLFDFGQSDDGLPGAGQLFLAMELLEGRSLQRAITDDGAMPWQRSLDVVIAVCRALVEAHDKGIIHRDLKPDNVMLVEGREPRVKVVDFGVAKLLEPSPDSSTMTGTGMVVGTPGYISPEQVNGVSDDPRSDLYALGVLWFEMLTGRAPFDGETPMKVVLRHLNDPAPRPSALATASLPREIDALVQRLLGKVPAARAPSSAALLDELLALSARREALDAEVGTASLSTDELRAVAERAAVVPASAPSSVPAPPATAPTGFVVAPEAMAAEAMAPQVPAPKKERGRAWLLGCIGLPLAVISIAAGSLIAIVAIVFDDERSTPPLSVEMNGGDVPEPGSRVNGVPVSDAVVKKALGKQLGKLVESALSGEGDAGVADLALKGALEVALESIEQSPDALARQLALRNLVRDLEEDLRADDVTPSRRQVLEHIIAKARRLEEQAREPERREP